MSAPQVLHVPTNIEAARIAREWLTPYVADLPDDVANDAFLLTSELVTNAVSYGLPDVEVSLVLSPPSLQVVVADRDDTLPTMPLQLPHPSRDNGRGLFLVASLAQAWGIDRLSPGPGKAVWFTLAIG